MYGYRNKFNCFVHQKLQLTQFELGTVKNIIIEEVNKDMNTQRQQIISLNDELNDTKHELELCKR